MVFQFTPWHLTLGGIEKSNQGHWVFIGLCIIDNVLLDIGVVMPRGLFFLSPLNLANHKIIHLVQLWYVTKGNRRQGTDGGPPAQPMVGHLRDCDTIYHWDLTLIGLNTSILISCNYSCLTKISQNFRKLPSQFQMFWDSFNVSVIIVHSHGYNTVLIYPHTPSYWYN